MLGTNHFAAIAAAVSIAMLVAGCGGGSGTMVSGDTPGGVDKTGTPAVLMPGDGLSASNSNPIVAADDTSTLRQSLENTDNVFPALTATLYRVFEQGSEGSELSKDFFVDTIQMNAEGAYVVNYVLDGTPGTVTITESDATGGGDYQVVVDGTRFSFWSSTSNDPFSDYDPFLDYMDSWVLSSTLDNASPRMWFVFGVESQALPVTGSATYLGSFQARAYKTGDPSRDHRWAITGAMRLVANFDMSRLEGKIDAIRNRESSGYRVDWPTSSFEITNGDVQGGQFTAILIGRDSNPNASFDQSVRSFSGAILGRFYGPNADEAGGVVAAERDENGDEHDRVLYGYFGGKNIEPYSQAASENGLEPLSGRVFGNGKDVLIVMVHGDVSRGGASDYMYQYAEQISEQFPGATVAAILRPGYFDADGRVSPGSNHHRSDQYTAENNRYLATTIENLKAAIAPERVFVVGHSGGAAQLGAVIGQSRNLIDGAVLVSCPCDLDQWRARRGLWPWPNSQSPSDFVDAVDSSIKVIAITGSGDTNTTQDLARAYVQALGSVGVDAEFVSADGGTHSYRTLNASVVSAINQLLTDLSVAGDIEMRTGSDLDMNSLGSWATITDIGVSVGIRHAGHDLFARYDADGRNPILSAASPMNQPTVSGTWSGRWQATYGVELESTDRGDARIDVSISGGRVEATLMYSGIDIPSVPHSIRSAPAPVTGGRFAPSASVTLEGGTRTTFAGEGQFGGADQQGVVGYVGGPDFRSIFYGDKQ